MISPCMTAAHTKSSFPPLILNFHPCPVSFVVRFWSVSPGLLLFPGTRNCIKDRGFRQCSEGMWKKFRNQVEQSLTDHSANFIEQFTCARSWAEPHWVEETGGSDPQELADWWRRQGSQQMGLSYAERWAGKGEDGWRVER